jgi:hypothetical protein
MASSAVQSGAMVSPDYLVSAPHVSNPAGIRFIVVSDIQALSLKN